MNVTRKEITSILKEGIVDVLFKKVDGTERLMKCTLSDKIIPAVEPSSEPKKERKINDSVLRVYDVEAQGWRSFKIDNIIEYSYNVE